MRQRVVWVNGAFGAGKTTVALRVAAALGAGFLDPEPLGSVLRAVLAPAVDDFQSLPEWRAATVATVAGQGPIVVVPMTVVDPQVFDETVGELRRRGADVRHVTLAARAETLRARLAGRPGETLWAEARVDACVEALASERFATHVDAERPLLEVVRDVLALAAGTPPAGPSRPPRAPGATAAEP